MRIFCQFLVMCYVKKVPLSSAFTGMFRQVKKRIDIDVYVMIRPRGADFCYDDVELEVMKEEIQIFKEAKADGIVLGILTP